MVNVVAAEAPFRGFDREAMGFLNQLAAEMNREWFEANKQRYQELWVAPMTALLDEVARGLARSFAPVKLERPKLFRVHRDTRFSKDKSPYKTHVAGIVPIGKRKPADGGCAALYLHLGVDEEIVAMGTYFFDAPQLSRFRKLVAADKTGKPLAALVERLRSAGYRVGGYDDYKKVPKGFDPAHPRAELLRMKGLGAAIEKIPRGLPRKAEFAEWIIDHGQKAAPLVAWLHANVR